MDDNNGGGIISKEKIDQVATWVGSTVSAAFFSSLERFSCVNIATSDPDIDDDDDDYNEDSYSTTTTTPTTTAPAVSTISPTATTNPPAVAQVNNNGHDTNDVSNLPV